MPGKSAPRKKTKGEAMKTKSNKSTKQATKSNKIKRQKDFTTALNTLIDNIEEWCADSPFRFWMGGIQNDEDTPPPIGGLI
jgi:hypothetical protein